MTSGCGTLDSEDLSAFIYWLYEHVKYLPLCRSDCMPDALWISIFSSDARECLNAVKSTMALRWRFHPPVRCVQTFGIAPPEKLSPGKKLQEKDIEDFAALYRATDPRDHIYGLHGLTDSIMTVDYTRSTTDVYLEFGTRAILRKRNLSLLKFAGLALQSQSHISLLSWVPNWHAVANTPLNHSV